MRTPTETIADLFAGLRMPDLGPRYNIAPTQAVAAVRHSNDGLQFAWLHWGLIPSWAKEKKIGNRMINARSETAREKPAFRSAFQRRRCLLFADGFYEWKKTTDGKQPIYFTLENEVPFCLAGLWECNRKIGESTGETIESCTILTTTPNTMVAEVHDRMPVILPPERYESWLDPDFQNLDVLQQWLVPFDRQPMVARAVSTRVNKAGYDQADCIDPVASQGQFGF